MTSKVQLLRHLCQPRDRWAARAVSSSLGILPTMLRIKTCADSSQPTPSTLSISLSIRAIELERSALSPCRLTYRHHKLSPRIQELCSSGARCGSNELAVTYHLRLRENDQARSRWIKNRKRDDSSPRDDRSSASASLGCTEDKQTSSIQPLELAVLSTNPTAAELLALDFAQLWVREYAGSEPDKDQRTECLAGLLLQLDVPEAKLHEHLSRTLRARAASRKKEVYDLENRPTRWRLWL